LIDAAVTKKVDGIAISLPSATALQASVRRAIAAGIPVITLNSGENDFKALGAITHVGQDESVAGAGAGEKLKAAGAKSLLCVIHEQGNSGLEQRCNGAKTTFGGTVEVLYVKGKSDINTTSSQISAKLSAKKTIDAVLTLDPDIAMAAAAAIKTAGSTAKLATFDMSGPVVAAIKAGTVLFAVDQQQYLQGYLAVTFLYLNITNANTVGGGLPVMTGPGFVDKTNVKKVEALAKAGSR
jgi:simple sugar transport system substrate-binding protein